MFDRVLNTSLSWVGILPPSSYKKTPSENILFLTNFRPMLPFYTPWKPPVKSLVLGVFRGYKMGTITRDNKVASNYLENVQHLTPSLIF